MNLKLLYVSSRPQFLKLKEWQSLWLEIRGDKYGFFSFSFTFYRKKPKAFAKYLRLREHSVPPDIGCMQGKRNHRLKIAESGVQGSSGVEILNCKKDIKMWLSISLEMSSNTLWLCLQK